MPFEKNHNTSSSYPQGVSSAQKEQGSPSPMVYSPEAEDPLIGAAITGYPDAIAQVLTLLPDDFCGHLAQPLAEAIHDLARTGVSVGIITVFDWLERHGKINDDLGQSTLAMLANDAPGIIYDAASFQSWAAIIRDRAIGRAEASYHTLLADAAIRRVKPSPTDLAPYEQALTRLGAGAESSLMLADDFLQEPDIPDLVHEMLPAQGLAMCHAKESQLKSFVVDDLFFHIATGRAWHGHKIIKPGPVCFVLNEGYRGFKKRLRGWEQKHGASLRGKVLIRKPSEKRSPFRLSDAGDVAQLITDLKHAGCVAVCFDTLTSMIPGWNPNGGDGGMVLALDYARQIYTQAGLLCLFVHHDNKAGEAKGATDFIFGMDARFSTKAEKDAGQVPTSVIVHCEKPRDDAPFADLVFAVERVSVPTEDDPHASTLVLVADRNASQQPQESADVRIYKQLLTILYNQGSSASSTKWESDARMYHGLSHGLFDTSRQALISHGYVSKGPNVRDPYRIAPKGLALIGKGPASPDDDFLQQSKQSETVTDYSDYANGQEEKQSNSHSVLDTDYLTVSLTVPTEQKIKHSPLVNSALPIDNQPVEHITDGALARQPIIIQTPTAPISDLETEREKRSASNPKLQAAFRPPATEKCSADDWTQAEAFSYIRQYLETQNWRPIRYGEHYGQGETLAARKERWTSDLRTMEVDTLRQLAHALYCRASLQTGG